MTTISSILPKIRPASRTCFRCAINLAGGLRHRFSLHRQIASARTAEGDSWAGESEIPHVSRFVPLFMRKPAHPPGSIALAQHIAVGGGNDARRIADLR